MRTLLMICSIVLTIASLAQYFAGDLPHATLFGFWVVVTLGVAWATTPALKIVGVRPRRPDDDRWRIVVRNRSFRRMRFSAGIESVDPSIAHHIPAPLQVTGSEPPHREGVINKEAEVDVVRMDDPPNLILATHVPEHRLPLHPLDRQHPYYTLRISVYPCPPDAGVADTRTFRVVMKGPGRDELEMIPESAARAVAAALVWFVGGLVPFFVGYGVGGLPAAAACGFGGVYLVWYAMAGSFAAHPPGCCATRSRVALARFPRARHGRGG